MKTYFAPKFAYIFLLLFSLNVQEVLPQEVKMNCFTTSNSNSDLKRSHIIDEIDNDTQFAVSVKFYFATIQHSSNYDLFLEVAMKNIALLNMRMNANNIFFKYEGYELLSQGFSEINDTGSEFGLAQLFKKGEPNMLNIFVIDTLFGSSGNAKAKLIPSKDLVITFDLLMNTYTNQYLGYDDSNVVLVHEVGHCFGLEHTFSEAYGNQIVNNPISGDGIADTPADKFIGSLSTDLDCIYIGAHEDENGDVYSPDTDLYMAYIPYSCRQRFSQDQIELMKRTLNTTLESILTNKMRLYEPFMGSYNFDSIDTPSFQRGFSYALVSCEANNSSSEEVPINNITGVEYKNLEIHSEYTTNDIVKHIPYTAIIIPELDVEKTNKCYAKPEEKENNIKLKIYSFKRDNFIYFDSINELNITEKDTYFNRLTNGLYIIQFYKNNKLINTKKIIKL